MHFLLAAGVRKTPDLAKAGESGLKTLDRTKIRRYNIGMENEKSFTIVVDGYCDELAEQLTADGVRIFPTRVFCGSEPISPPASNPEREKFYALAKLDERTVIPAKHGDFERFFDAILEEGDGGNILAVLSAPSGDVLAAQAAAKTCSIKFFGSRIYVLDAPGLGAALVPVLEAAQAALKANKSVEDALADCQSIAKRVRSSALVPDDSDGLSTYKLMRIGLAASFSRRVHGDARAAALIAAEAAKVEAECVYVSHCDNAALARKVAFAVNQAAPNAKIKLGQAAFATLAATAPLSVTVAYVLPK